MHTKYWLITNQINLNCTEKPSLLSAWYVSWSTAIKNQDIRKGASVYIASVVFVMWFMKFEKKIAFFSNFINHNENNIGLKTETPLTF